MLVVSRLVFAFRHNVCHGCLCVPLSYARRWGLGGSGGVRLRGAVAARYGGSLEERESIEYILGGIDVALAIPGVLRKDAGFHQRADCVACRLTS